LVRRTPTHRYLTRGAVFGQARFHGVQRGPVSSGRRWLVHVDNISVTPYTYAEAFSGDDAVLSRDNLKIAFSIHTVWRIDDTRVPLFMDRFSTTVQKNAPTSFASPSGPLRATKCSGVMAWTSKRR
jgi:hypothetical protein